MDDTGRLSTELSTLKTDFSDLKTKLNALEEETESLRYSADESTEELKDKMKAQVGELTAVME